MGFLQSHFTSLCSQNTSGCSISLYLVGTAISGRVQNGALPKVVGPVQPNTLNNEHVVIHFTGNLFRARTHFSCSSKAREDRQSCSGKQHYQHRGWSVSGRNGATNSTHHCSDQLMPRLLLLLLLTYRRKQRLVRTALTPTRHRQTHVSLARWRQRYDRGRCLSKVAHTAISRRYT